MLIHNINQKHKVEMFRKDPITSQPVFVLQFFMYNFRSISSTYHTAVPIILL